MDLPDGANQSFIIRLWIEETAAEAGCTRWRGHITHVRSGKRQYLHELSDIVPFIRDFLRRMEPPFPEGDS